MIKIRWNPKKIAIYMMGLILACLLLLGGFVLLYNNGERLDLLNHGPFAGPLEIIVILVGLALVSIGGLLGFSSLGKVQPRPIAYDISVRLVATGYLVAAISAMADYLGIGAHHQLPYFGPLQSAGVLFGEAAIAIGFLLMFLSKKYD
jgi:hypothetical protein